MPDVPPGSRFLGTFDREEAVERETLDFFASGHPLVEGILHELEEGPRGRVSLLQIPGAEEAFGLLAIYKRGNDFEAVVVDRNGLRPDLAERLVSETLRPEPIDIKKWTGQAGWAKTVRKLAAALPDEPPLAVAAVRIRRS